MDTLVPARQLRRRRASLRSLVVAASVLMLVAGCAERAAERAFDAAMAEADDAAPAVLRERLAEVERRWPDTRAADRARREIEWIDDLRHVSVRAPQLMAWDAVRDVANAAERFKLRHGRFPRSVDELVPGYLPRPVVDPWGHPILYQRHAAGYRVICYGEDGIPGGSGLASDVLVETGREVKIGSASVG